MKELNILSIDFDFFQNVKTVKTLLHCYPDGVDLPSQITAITWASRYLCFEKELLEITADTAKIKEITEIVRKNCNVQTPVMVTNSHVHIYEFIKDLIDTNEPDSTYIVNIDMHHDTVNGNKELDCGNWISHVKKDFDNCEVQWIANPISKEAYALDDEMESYIETDFESIKDIKFDAIFICRSDTWLPVHLDKDFDAFLKDIVAMFPCNMVEKSVQHPREIVRIARKEKEWQEEIRKAKPFRDWMESNA